MDTFYIFDIESDGLLEEATKIHCLVYVKYYKGEIIERKSITDYNEIKLFFSDKESYYVGHNIIRFDIPLVEKLLEIDLSDLKLVDTLGISWYLYPLRKKHGLELWGEDLGIKKPEISDWSSLSTSDYIHRCEEDVKINLKLFRKFFNYLNTLYDDYPDMLRLICYTNFKLSCLRMQEKFKIKLDSYTCMKHLTTLEYMLSQKTDILVDKMPKDLGKVLRTKPKVMYKKDGTLSSHGVNWFNLLKKFGLPEDVETIRELPNPGSNNQLKDWLYLLGWEPITFKESKATGKKVEQVSLPFGQGICSSVKDLYDKEPALVELDNYFKIKHRIGLLKGFLKDRDKNDYIISTAHGFTNTMRLKHRKPVANLPKAGTFYGSEIRECLTVPDADKYLMCGSDISSLEDNTKQHYIYFYDPEYVTEMRVPGFDPHLDIGVLAGLISLEESDFFKWADVQKELSLDEKLKYSKIKKSRFTAKTTNFAATYGAGGPKIAETAKIPLEEGNRLHEIYWKRNKAVKEVARNSLIKDVWITDKAWRFIETEILNEKGNIEIKKEKTYVDCNIKHRWIFNPVSKLWMYLKADKDRFSTLNQSTGVFVFDSWLKEALNRLKDINTPVVMQYHDELVIVLLKEYKEQVSSILYESIEKVNETLNLNVDIGITVDFGKNYSEIH